jgi:hypothetical protein
VLFAWGRDLKMNSQTILIFCFSSREFFSSRDKPTYKNLLEWSV